MRSAGIIILAAGVSSRLGRPKQLLEFQGASLILRAVRTALESQCGPVSVVLGAHGQRIERELAGLPITIVRNVDWGAGIGTSIRAGAQRLMSSTNPPDTILLMLSDQPFVTSDFLRELARACEERGGIAAAAYAGTLGVPAGFDKRYHAELAALSASQGAKRIIERHREFVHALEFPGAATDIDTAADYENLLQEAQTGKNHEAKMDC